MVDTTKLKKGDIVEHRLSKDWVLVLSVLENAVVCRTKAFEQITFQDFELQYK